MVREIKLTSWFIDISAHVSVNPADNLSSGCIHIILFLNTALIFFSAILWFMDCHPNLTENFSPKLYCSCAKNFIDVATSHWAICHSPSLIFSRCLRWMDHLLALQLWIHQLLSLWWKRCVIPGGSGKHRGYFCVPGRGQWEFSWSLRTRRIAFSLAYDAEMIFDPNDSRHYTTKTMTHLPDTFVLWWHCSFSHCFQVAFISEA